MEKVVMLCLLVFSLDAKSVDVTKKCLACHQKQQIPTELIYKRYLLKYSTKTRMHKAIYTYLKSPDKTDSIMPPQFFLKFPMKPNLKFSDSELHENIDAFLDYYDVKKRLLLSQTGK